MSAGESAGAQSAAFVVVTAAGGVSDAAAEAVAFAADAEASSRLGPEGVEIALGAPPGPDLLAAARAAAPGLDVNVAPSAPRRKRLLLADMDGTITDCECIDEIAAAAGVGEAVSSVTAQAMAGALDFEEALRARVALLEGFAEAQLEDVWRDRVRLSPGAARLVRSMRESGAAAVLVSGGFTFFTERVSAAAGFTSHHANTLLATSGALTGAVGEPILGRDAKREALERYCAELGLTPADVIAVGDGANDLAMIEAAGCGVAYKGKPVLAEAADARLDHSDLSALLYLQGWRAEEMAADAALTGPVTER